MIATVFQVYEVDGQSMEATLHDNDRLVVFKTPRTWARVTGNDYIPKRYDIIIFNQPSAPEHGSKRQLIKRVIGLPGDRVVISDGKVVVYSPDSPDGYAVDDAGPEYEASASTPGNVGLTVPEGEVFVLGDNRANSSDSRVFGTVPSEQIVGKLGFRFYPLSQTDSF
jgi:signal peptidase I